MSKLNALIVEDEPMLFRQLEALLTRSDYNVIRRSDGKIVDSYDSAVKLIDQQYPDIAILDIHLKGDKDGLDIADYLRAKAKCFIVILTDNDSDHNKARANNLSTDGFLIKLGKLSTDRQMLAAIDSARQRILSMREITYLNVTELAAIHVNDQTKITSGSDSLYLNTPVDWQNVAFIEAFNQQEKNTLLIHYAGTGKTFKYRSSLAAILKIVPLYFCQVNKFTIVNLKRRESIALQTIEIIIARRKFQVSDHFHSEVMQKLKKLHLY